MFGFGVLMVLILWGYFELHTRPFRPLQLAIAARFPDSSPIVNGGKHKSHKAASKKTLRIAVRVPQEEFDPTQDEARSQERARELYRMSLQYMDVKSYEVLEIHLHQRDPEREEKYWSKVTPVEELESAFPSPETAG